MIIGLNLEPKLNTLHHPVAKHNDAEYEYEYVGRVLAASVLMFLFILCCKFPSRVVANRVDNAPEWQEK